MTIPEVEFDILKCLITTYPNFVMVFKPMNGELLKRTEIVNLFVVASR